MRPRTTLQAVLSRLDNCPNSHVMDMLGRGLNALPPLASRMRFVKCLVFVQVCLLGRHFGLSPATAALLAKETKHMLPNDSTVTRWGKQSAAWWAAVLTAHGLPVMARRVSVTNSLALA